MATMRKVLEKLWQHTQFEDTETRSDSVQEAQNSEMYNFSVDDIRESEYPTLMGTTYLDHAGTTPYAKSTIEKYTADLTTNLFGNPHSASASSQLSTRRVDDVRLNVLKFFGASPEEFDLVFVANATAAIKLVAEACRDSLGGFWHGYHRDSHTSSIGCRELASQGTKCFEDDQSMDCWISDLDQDTQWDDVLKLITYPGQSNMTGRQLPLSWPQRIREAASSSHQQIYTLLDAASFASTSPLDLSDALYAPDFIALSFYKIFGFPDLGALIVRKDSANVLMNKHYFAGGTVDAVVTLENKWHMKKETVHGALEEGTLPFHNIIALEHAMAVHARLFGSMNKISQHVQCLRNEALQFLANTCHANGAPICAIYEDGKGCKYGPLLAFNLKDSSGQFISAAEVEKLCTVKGIQLRTGGLCNPGGIAHHLNLSHDDIRSNYEFGHRCGGESTLINGKPTGAIRISLGAMSTRSDVHNFIRFVKEYFVQHDLLLTASQVSSPRLNPAFVESLCVFPIKSCAAFQIPANQKWLVTPTGLAWDREWCLVHEGTNVALSQKRYPRMALLHPNLNLVTRIMTVILEGDEQDEHVAIDMDDMSSATPIAAKTCEKDAFALRASRVCGDAVFLHVYNSTTVNGFFSRVLGVSCCLARHPSTGQLREVNIRRPLEETSTLSSPLGATSTTPQVRLANESPMLIVSRSSVNELSRCIRQSAQDRGETQPRKISASSFRANIVVAENTSGLENEESPYDEDKWTSIAIRPASNDFETTNILPKESDTQIAYHTSTHSPESPSIETSTSQTFSLPGSFTSDITNATHYISAPSSRTSISDHQASLLSRQPKKLLSLVNLDILGPCQRCQMVSIDQATAKTQQEPFSTLAKTRRKGDGRVWFGVHAALRLSPEKNESGEVYVQVGDIVEPRY